MYGDGVMNRRQFLAAAGGLAAARAVLAAAPTSRPATQASVPESLPWDNPPAGSVIGRILFDGQPPDPVPIDCSADPNCAALYKSEPLLTEDLVVGPGGGLANAFVSVKKGLEAGRKWPVPQRAVVLDQKGCCYIPHVFGVMAGQPLEILNSSRINEVPHGYPRRNPEFSFTLPKRGMRKAVVLNEPETFRIGCDVHPWEIAWCHVMAHPFFTLTDAEGRFMIRDLPPGEYELELWHELPTLGSRTQAVRVEATRAARVAEVKWPPTAKQ